LLVFLSTSSRLSSKSFNLAFSTIKKDRSLFTSSSESEPESSLLLFLLTELCVSYGPPWAHYLGGYRDRLLGGPLGLPGLRCTVPDGVKHKDYRGEVLG
jgi:hypothetical protein